MCFGICAEIGVDTAAGTETYCVIGVMSANWIQTSGIGIDHYAGIMLKILILCK